MNKNKQVGIKH